MRMSIVLKIFLIVSSVLICLDNSTIAADFIPDSPTPQAQKDLPVMLKIEWSAGKHMPQGMQDNHVNIIDNWLVSVGGFCQGGDNDWKPGIYPRGFLNKTWGLDLSNKNSSWIELPPYPGSPRQAMQGVRVGDELYLWGGFSYTEPYTYQDGHRLSRVGDVWKWTPLPQLPHPSCWAAMASIGPIIYSVGGADYDSKSFYTLNDRTGKTDRFGSRIYQLDTNHLEKGWKELTSCPGTPRCLTTAAVVNGKIFVIGGVAVMKTGTYCNVVDCWCYDPEVDQWERLRDTPISGTGNTTSTIVFQNRYLLLPCGYQYNRVMDQDGNVRPRYGIPSKVKRTWKEHPRYETTSYYNHCFVYDTKNNLFGTSTDLPFDDVGSITVIKDHTVYIFPGETGGFEWEGEYFGHHPEFVLKGKIEELNWK